MEQNEIDALGKAIATAAKAGHPMVSREKVVEWRNEWMQMSEPALKTADEYVANKAYSQGRSDAIEEAAKVCESKIASFCPCAACQNRKAEAKAIRALAQESKPEVKV